MWKMRDLLCVWKKKKKMHRMWKWEVYCVCGQDEGCVQEEVIEKKKLKRKKGKEQRGCCSFHYCGWREELNGRIDKRLKKDKRKIGGWWEERKEIFYAIFLHHRAAEKKEKWIENRLRKREEIREERNTIEKGSPGCCWFFRITGLLLIFFITRLPFWD